MQIYLSNFFFCSTFSRSYIYLIYSPESYNARPLETRVLCNSSTRHYTALPHEHQNFTLSTLRLIAMQICQKVRRSTLNNISKPQLNWTTGT
jgi:hypothetical protein